MNQGKTMREDCRGEVFSQRVMVGDTPGKWRTPVRPTGRLHTMAVGKSDDNKSRNRID